MTGMAETLRMHDVQGAGKDARRQDHTSEEDFPSEERGDAGIVILEPGEGELESGTD